MSAPTSPTLTPRVIGPNGRGTLTPLVDASPQAITVVNQGTKTFTVAGDFHSAYGNGRLRIQGSTGNDGTYTVMSATFVTDHTNIVVSEAIPNATADGSAYADVLKPALTAGDAFALSGKESLLVSNGSGSAVTVTIKSAPDNFGAYHSADDLAVVVPAGDTALIGPLAAALFIDSVTGLAQISYSAVASVAVALLNAATTS